MLTRETPGWLIHNGLGEQDSLSRVRLLSGPKLHECRCLAEPFGSILCTSPDQSKGNDLGRSIKFQLGFCRFLLSECRSKGQLAAIGIWGRAHQLSKYRRQVCLRGESTVKGYVGDRQPGVT